MIHISYRDNVRGTCKPLTSMDKLMELVRDPKTAYNVRQYRKLRHEAELEQDPERKQQIEEHAARYKRLLPMAVWQGFVPEGEMPRNDNVTLTGLYATDWDHVPDARTLAFQVAAHAEVYSLVMVHITPSGDGVRAIGLCQPGKPTLQENQEWLSQLFGVPNDPVTSNPGRTWFLCQEEDIMYLDPGLLDRQVRQIPGPPQSPLKGEDSAQKVLPLREDLGGSGSELLPSSLRAFDLCVREAGLKADQMDVWGQHTWHQNLLAVLSVGLPKLMSRGQLEAVIATRLPNYSRTQDCRTLVQYFYEKYNAQCGYMSETLRRISAKAQSAGNDDDDTLRYDDDDHDANDDGNSYRLTAPPVMAPGVQEFVDACPTVPQKASAAVTAIVAWTVLLTHLRCRIKGGALELVACILAYVWGSSSVGKTSLTKWVLWTILGARDGKGLDTLSGLDNLFMDYWTRQQKKQQALGGGAKKGITTEDYPMRIINLDTTAPGLMKHFIDSMGLHSILYVQDHDMLVANAGMAAWRKNDSDLRAMYDAEWMSKKTATLSGLSGRARALGSCLICGTEGDIDRYYLGSGQQIVKGLAGRTFFLHLTGEYLNRQWPRDLTKGELKTVRRLAKKALDETVRVAETADENGEPRYEVTKLPERQVKLEWLWDYMEEEFEQRWTLRFILDGREKNAEILARCKETAVRGAMALYWLWGCKNDETTKQRLREATMWLAVTMMNGILELFQQKLENPDLRLRLSIPQQSVWEAMPDVFNHKMLEDVMRRLGRSSQTYVVINKWRHLRLPGSQEEGMIVKVGDWFYKRGSESLAALGVKSEK